MLKIEVQGRNIERALKKYKSKIIKTHQMRELNSRKYYKKPSEERREEIQKAVYVDKKKKEDEY